MKKKAVETTISDLEAILARYLDSEPGLNYAIKILGNPGVGKSAIVKEVSDKMNFYFIDTRLAFKENIDLGGYPVPDHDDRRMIYYRPRFIPPETVPEGYNGIVWFLDESNRAHPTVIQTLFQIITEGVCGEHRLPEKTYIVLAGNLGESDFTTVTDFDDAALDGRLAVFHLKPSAGDWLRWATAEKVHPSVIRYISLFPEKLWDEANIDPNPRGWHQVSQTLLVSYGLKNEDETTDFLRSGKEGTLVKTINSLVGDAAGNEFVMELTAPRKLTTREVIAGSRDKLDKLKKNEIPSEDVLWAVSGALSHIRGKNILLRGDLSGEDLRELGNLLAFIGFSRADSRISFFYLLMKSCGIFTQIPPAIRTVDDETVRRELKERFDAIMAMEM